MPLGMALLRDHMALPQKFLFVEVLLPAGAVAGALGDSLTLEVHLAPAATLPPRRLEVALRLHCVAAVNVVAQEAMPLRHTWAHSSHVLRPEAERSGGPEGCVLAIAEVLAVAPQGPATPLTPWHRRAPKKSCGLAAPVYALEPGPGPPTAARLRPFSHPNNPPSAVPPATDPESGR